MSSELAVREMILGVLKSKDVSGRNVIHSSDFRTAITDLGYPMGSSVVENILVYCKLDAIGNLDFSELERELVRQRRVLQANKKPEHKAAATSSGAVSKPWRADVAHKAKVEAERQMRMVSEHNTEINKVYAALSHHEISANDALNALYSMEIAPTKAFMKVLQNMTINDVSYSEFIKSLTKFDPNASDLDDQQVFAGSAPNRGDVSFISDHQSKRISANTRSAFFQTDAANADVKPKPFRKMTSANSTGVTDAMIFKTQATKEVIFSGDDTIPLLSHNQLDMVEGTMGESVSVTFNSELKLQREQVLAALRKLDAGVISMDDFQDMLFSMGMDLPETMITSIRRAVVSGRMDIRHFVKLLDASIFKSTAIEDRVRDDDVHSLQAKFRRGVMRFGVDAITNLALVFRKMDSDQDGCLTFTEFRQGCNKLQLLSSASSQRNKNITSSSSQGRRDSRASNDQLSDEELRTLFHAFDSNGDGVLQYHELLQALMGQLSAKRRAIIRKAFQKLDRHAEDKLLIDTIAEHFNASQHPLVLANERSEREVTSDLVHWLTNAMPSSLSSESKSKSHHSGSRNGTSGENTGSFDGYVSYPIFEQYFASLSAAIDDDAAFEAMMTGCFQLSSKAAAPPVFRLRQGAQHSNATPMAIQTHGDCIAWQQEASIIEEQSRQQRKEGRRIIGGYQRNNSHHTNVVNWHNHGGETKSYVEAVQEEMSRFGIMNVSKGLKNVSSKSLLAWQTPKASAKDVSVTVFSPKSTSSFTTAEEEEDEDHVPGSSTGLFQEEFKSAGSRTRAPTRVSAASKPNAGKVREFYTLKKPYGVDEEPSQRGVDSNGTSSSQQSSKTQNGGLGAGGGSGKVKSLADIMKSKNGQTSVGGGRSLAEYMR